MKQQLENLVGELKSRQDVLGVAVFGSYARGEARRNSDIDILVLIRKGVRRDVERREGYWFEFVYASFSEALKFYRHNPNDCVQLWRDAVILYDRNGSMRRLRTFAQRMENSGKAKPSAERLKHLRFDAEDSIRAIRSLAAADPAAANLNAAIKAANLLELYFDTRELWTPPPKKQLAAVRDIAAKDGKIFDSFFLATSIPPKLRALSRIIDIVFD